MFERECRLFTFMWEYTKRLTADLTDGQLSIQPRPGINTPAWLLGHLAMAKDYALQLMGQPTICPASWNKTYGIGSNPDNVGTGGPTKAELMTINGDGVKRVLEAARQVSIETMGQPNPKERLRPILPTLGDFVAHLLTTHEASHLGQLSAWRRQLGLPSVL